jgi:hypothetical protein
MAVPAAGLWNSAIFMSRADDVLIRALCQLAKGTFALSSKK